MRQSRRASFIESVLNTLSAFCLSLVVCRYLLPLFGYDTSWSDAGIITLVFTALSIVRNYIIRRLFVWIGGRNV